MSERRFTKTQEREIAREYRAGGTIRSIADARGQSPNAVYGVLKRAEVLRPKGGVRRLNDKMGRTLRAEYEGGASLEMLARREGCGREAVRTAIRAVGGTFLPPGGRKRDWPVAEIVEARLAGETQEAIGERFGIGQGTVSKILAAEGMATRRNPNKQRRIETRQGYVLVFIEQDDPMTSMRHRLGYVMEHRLVMARSLGRPLTHSEQVHHVNGDRADNRLENLQLRNGSHGSGQRYVCADCGSHNVVPADLK